MVRTRASYKSISHLTRACRTLAANCVEGIGANTTLLERRVAESMTLVTALNPVIGYENASRLAKHALANGSTIVASAQALGILSAQEIEHLLVPEQLTKLA